MNCVFRFRITLKNGLEFRFSFSRHYEKQIWISFVILAWLEKRITAPVQSFEAPATPSGLTGAFTFYVCESKWIFLSPGPKWVVNSPHPLPMMRNSTENRKNPAKIRVLFCWLGFNLFWPKLNKKGRYGKVLKISPGHIYFKGPFWGAYLRLSLIHIWRCRRRG